MFSLRIHENILENTEKTQTTRPNTNQRGRHHAIRGRGRQQCYCGDGGGGGVGPKGPGLKVQTWPPTSAWRAK